MFLIFFKFVGFKCLSVSLLLFFFEVILLLDQTIDGWINRLSLCFETNWGWIYLLFSLLQLIFLFKKLGYVSMVELIGFGWLSKSIFIERKVIKVRVIILIITVSKDIFILLGRHNILSVFLFLLLILLIFIFLDFNLQLLFNALVKLLIDLVVMSKELILWDWYFIRLCCFLLLILSFLLFLLGLLLLLFGLLLLLLGLFLRFLKGGLFLCSELSSCLLLGFFSLLGKLCLHLSFSFGLFLSSSLFSFLFNFQFRLSFGFSELGFEFSLSFGFLFGGSFLFSLLLGG